MVSIGALVTAKSERNQGGTNISVLTPRDFRCEDNVGKWLVKVELKECIRERRPGKFGVYSVRREYPVVED